MNDKTAQPEVTTAIQRLKSLNVRLIEATSREDQIAYRVTSVDCEPAATPAAGETLHALIGEAEEMLGRIMRSQDTILAYL